MPFIPKAQFRHRHCTDGTWDSICLRCFRTAAGHTTEERLLADAEAVHKCDPVTLVDYSSDQTPPKKPPAPSACRC